MRRTLLPIVLVSVGALAGCKPIADAGGTAAAIDGVRWLLTTFDANGTAAHVPAGSTVDATFANGTVSGSGGCNAYNASYTALGTQLTIGPVAATRKACIGPAGDVENAYLAALAGVTSYAVTNERLTLVDASGTASLTFVRGPANPLAGSS